MTQEERRIRLAIMRGRYHEAFLKWQEEEPPKWRFLSHLRWVVSCPPMPMELEDC